VACYTSRTYDERKQIQGLWEAGVQAKEIAEKLSMPLTTIYAELRRGQDGTRLPNMRMRYDADLAQLRLQQSYERRGRKGGVNESE
jgi:IS30 family transposase